MHRPIHTLQIEGADLGIQTRFKPTIKGKLSRYRTDQLNSWAAKLQINLTKISFICTLLRVFQWRIWQADVCWRACHAPIRSASLGSAANPFSF